MSGTTLQARDLRVLVVDDEPAVAIQLAQGLEASGFKVELADNAPRALAVMLADPGIGVVVSDIRMPGGDGLQLARDIHGQCAEGNAIEVVVITGHATIEDAADAVRSRVSDFLRKPFRLACAVAAVRQAMDRALARRTREAERQQMKRRLLDDEARRSELERRLTSLTERLAAMEDTAPAVVAVQDKLHAVSHALRTPLNAISASAELLHGAPMAAEAQDYQRILHEGITEASHAIQLVEELILAEDRPQDEAARMELGHLLGVALRRQQARGVRHRIDAPQGALDLAVTGPRTALARALDLAIEAALAWAPPSRPEHPGELRLRCELARIEEDGRAWACMTLVAGASSEPPDPLPGTPVLEAQGTRLSRTLESLGYLVARRLLEREGGSLSSMVTPSGDAVLRMAWPLDQNTTP